MAIPGSNIRVLRQQLGLSQKALAAAVSMDIGNLSRLEAGKSGYSRETIERIAKALNVSIGVLFADTVTVEAAALRMRNIPLLTHEQLIQWNGPDSLDFTDEQEFLHADLRRFGRNTFALRVQNDANAPRFVIGDDLIFDAGIQPVLGDVVVAQDGAGAIYIGRLRPVAGGDGGPQCEVLPADPIFGMASSLSTPGFRLRGRLVEFRRFIP